MTKQSPQPKATRSAVSIGISDKDRAAIAQGQSPPPADTYTLYLTTHNFHWNVECGRPHRRAHPRPGPPSARLVHPIRPAQQPARRPQYPTQSDGDGAHLGRRPRSRGPHRPQPVPGSRQSQRRAHRRRAGATLGGARTNRLDAAQLAGGVIAVTPSNRSMCGLLALDRAEC